MLCALSGDVCTLSCQPVLPYQKVCSGNAKTFCYKIRLYVWSVISISPNSFCLYSTGGKIWFYLCKTPGPANKSYSCLSLFRADLLALMEYDSRLPYICLCTWSSQMSVSKAKITDRNISAVTQIFLTIWELWKGSEEVKSFYVKLWQKQINTSTRK